ncbi:MAG: L-lactate dehydrogenase [Desulfomonilaceae bacterium]
MKVGIVGCGLVGSSAAFAIVLTGSAESLVLVDINGDLANAQAEDILHATPFSNTTAVSAGNYDSLKGCSLVILSCGVAQRPGESRLALLKRNSSIFADVIPKVLEHAPDTLFLIATNPVDILTDIVARSFGLPLGRVFGSGTSLDTARFRSLIGTYLGVSAQSVHAYVLGEHGDSEVLLWSSARVAGIPLDDFGKQVSMPLTNQIKNHIDERVRRAAYRIIQGKGATNYGIGAGLARITKAVRDDDMTVLTLSMPADCMECLAGISMSLPRILGAKGVTGTVNPVLSKEEEKALCNSAELLRATKSELG